MSSIRFRAKVGPFDIETSHTILTALVNSAHILAGKHVSIGKNIRRRAEVQAYPVSRRGDPLLTLQLRNPAIVGLPFGLRGLNLAPRCLSRKGLVTLSHLRLIASLRICL